jgi:hypothetical protein
MVSAQQAVRTTPVWNENYLLALVRIQQMVGGELVFGHDDFDDRGSAAAAVDTPSPNAAAHANKQV